MSHPRDVGSAVSDLEADKLTELARGKIVLEIGAFTGFSTIVLARAAERVHTIDWFKGDAQTGRADYLPVFWYNLGKHGMRDKIVVHVGNIHEILPCLRDANFDLIFIDAFHEEETVYADAMAASTKLKAGGTMAFHDFGKFGVEPAVRRFANGRRIELFGTLAVIRGERP